MLWEMTKWKKKKEFEKVFLPFNSKGKQIWVISRIKQLPCEIVDISVRLAELEFVMKHKLPPPPAHLP